MHIYYLEENVVRLIALIMIYMLFFFLINYSVCIHSNNSKIPIKIVNEYAKGEDLGLGFGGLTDDELNSLSVDDKKRNHMKIKPAPFSGPEQFRKLSGSCFSHLDDKYKFQLCPFSNFTQEEIQATYEPFKGILGVWGEWMIENNTFVSMHFLRGAKCGHGLDRSVKILLKCGNTNYLSQMTEPSKCHYEGVFQTPLTCGKNAMLVYPRLSKELKQEWDEIETEWFNEIITQKGYDEELKRLFVKAGYQLSEEDKALLSEQEIGRESKCETTASLEKRVKELEKTLLEKEEIIRNLTARIGG